MALYEHLLIARQDISAQAVDALATHLKTIVEGEGGKVEKQEYWGLRTLAYRIKKNRKGHYVLLNINAPANAIIELERQLKINEDVLRYITVRVEASSNRTRAGNAKERDEREIAVRVMKPRPKSKERRRYEHTAALAAPAVLPPPQDMSLLRRQRAQDRLQGREAAAAFISERGKIVPSRITAVSPRSSASWRTRSSAPASWRFCLTSRCGMQVILLERVEKLGQMGDVVKVKDGFARNLPSAQEEGAARDQG